MLISCLNEDISYPSLGIKQIWLGGTPSQTTLARTFMNKVKVQDLENVFEPLFYYWKRKRQTKESFGDFTNRIVRTLLFQKELLYTSFKHSHGLKLSTEMLFF